MTNYYKDNWDLYSNGSNRFKELFNKARKNITVDLGGLTVGLIGLIFMF